MEKEEEGTIETIKKGIVDKGYNIEEDMRTDSSIHIMFSGNGNAMNSREQSVGNWIFERSSGYAGWRCTKCGVWIYDKQPYVCDCDKKIISLYL